MQERASYYRIVFGLAALYNLAFGAWAGFAPDRFFSVFGMRAPIYPSIWACLGMVVGTYGLAYGYAALRLDRAAPFIAIGLLGKILGPIGWVLTVRSGEWPARTFTLILFNDLVWWLPFALFLIDRTRAGARLRALAAPACAGFNAAAALALLAVLKPGTEVIADAAQRVSYIASHESAWRAGWALWIVSALSLLAFYAWWGSRLRRRVWALAAFLIAIAGAVCDLTAESLFIGWLPDGIEPIQRAGSLLTGGAANGLYTVAGILLTLQTPGLRRGLGVWTWGVWASGIGLTMSAIAGSVPWMMATSASLMILFCPWTWVMGRRLR